jgi:hypothetical protein
MKDTAGTADQDEARGAPLGVSGGARLRAGPAPGAPGGLFFPRLPPAERRWLRAIVLPIIGHSAPAPAAAY